MVRPIVIQTLCWSNHQKMYIWRRDGEYSSSLPHREVGGHFAPTKIATKVFQCGFYWPTLFKDTHAFVELCNACQRNGNIYKRNEKTLNNILEVELFDVWEIDFIGLFPSSYGN